MGLLIGLALGLGLVLIVDGWTNPPPTRVRRDRVSRLTVLLQRAGVNATPRAVVSVAVVLACTAAFLALAITGVPAVGLLAAVAAGWIPAAVLQSMAARRQREHAEAWPDAVDHLASAVRAGLSLPEALIGLGERGPEQLRPPFRQFGREYQSTGRFNESLDRLKDRLADPVGDRVVEALRIAREVGGGDLGRILRTLSGFLRDDLRARGELESRQSWTVAGARLAVAAPWLVLMVMSLQRDVIARFATPTGIAVLVGGAVTCVVAYRLMVRLGRLPTERRILA